MRHTHQQALAFQAVDRLTQRATTDAVGARQLRLGDLAAWGDLAFDDGRLNASEDVFRERLGIVAADDRGIELIQHDCRHLQIQCGKN